MILVFANEHKPQPLYAFMLTIRGETHTNGGSGWIQTFYIFMLVRGCEIYTNGRSAWIQNYASTTQTFRGGSSWWRGKREKKYQQWDMDTRLQYKLK